MLSFFPRDFLDEILNLIESVSEGFPSYSSMPFTCGYCPNTTVDFKEIVNRLVTDNSNKEIKLRKFDGSYLRKLNFNVIPELCREQGREITLNENIGTIHVSKSRKENPQKLTQLSSRSHPRHLVGKRTAQKTPS